MFVGIALLTAFVWVLCASAGPNTWVCAAIAVVVGHTLRMTGLYRAWEAPPAKEPAGLYLHDDDRPLPGRTLKGKSPRVLKAIGLVTGDDQPEG